MIISHKQLLYFNYAVDDPLVQKQIEQQGIRSIRMNPVCPKCERVAFHHLVGVQCHACGHFSPEKTPLFKDHLMDIESL